MTNLRFALSQEDAAASSRDLENRHDYDPQDAGFHIMGAKAPPVNILAIAAPELGKSERGQPYSAKTLEDMYGNAFEGFRLVKAHDTDANNKKTRITSGLWGAGAFGHSAEMSLAVQYLAARVAKVDEIEFTGIKDKDWIQQTVFQAVDQILDQTDQSAKRTGEPFSVANALDSLLRVSFEQGWTTKPFRKF